MKPFQIAALGLVLMGCGEAPNCPEQCESIQTQADFKEMEIRISDLEGRMKQLVIEICDTREKVLMLCQKQDIDCHEIEEYTLCQYDTDQ